jgi:hypothetical protein
LRAHQTQRRPAETAGESAGFTGVATIVRVQRGQIERIVFVFGHLGFGVDSDQGPKCEVDGFARAMQVIPLDR